MIRIAKGDRQVDQAGAGEVLVADLGQLLLERGFAADQDLEAVAPVHICDEVGHDENVVELVQPVDGRGVDLDEREGDVAPALVLCDEGRLLARHAEVVVGGRLPHDAGAIGHGGATDRCGLLDAQRGELLHQPLDGLAVLGVGDAQRGVGEDHDLLGRPLDLALVDGEALLDQRGRAVGVASARRFLVDVGVGLDAGADADRDDDDAEPGGEHDPAVSRAPHADARDVGVALGGAGCRHASISSRRPARATPARPRPTAVGSRQRWAR